MPAKSAAAVVWNDKIYLIGGISKDGDYLDETEYYDGDWHKAFQRIEHCPFFSLCCNIKQ